MTDEASARSLARTSFVLAACVPVVLLFAFVVASRAMIGHLLLVLSAVLALGLAVASVVCASRAFSRTRRSKIAGTRTLPIVALVVSIVVTTALILLIGLVVLVLIGLSNLQ